MPNLYQKVRPGTPFQQSAVAQNAMIDAAVANKNKSTGVSETVARYGNGMVFVLVRNNTGDSQDRYAALAIETPLITPDENDATFRGRIMFDGTTPATEDIGQFCILFEPLADQQIGRAIISGPSIAQIDITDSTHQFADVIDGSTTLTSAASGAAKILWKSDDTGDAVDAVVLIGGGGGGGSLSAPTTPGQIPICTAEGVYAWHIRYAGGP